jgi:PEGA domain
VFGSRGAIISPRGFGSRGVIVGPRGFGSRGVIVASRGFSRPYYSFRPRLSLGFGLWVGFPVAYPYYGYPDYGYGYPYPAPYPYPDPYGYPASAYPAYGGGYPPASYGGYPPSSPSYPAYPAQPQTSVGAQPGQTSGGVSFEITPGTAEVYVDGEYVGTASTFGPSFPPLSLTPGRHNVEVRAPGYQTIAFDADVIPGQVIPYQGAMQRGR